MIFVTLVEYAKLVSKDTTFSRTIISSVVFGVQLMDAVRALRPVTALTVCQDTI